jgi:prepilin-type N-terminal cleavage/methylation domain-containing protein
MSNSLFYKSRLRGFTLIELLIVVAIIGILASIAMVNFLTAQMRAKVVKVKSDVRIIALAADLYIIDYNHYPPSPWIGRLTKPGGHESAYMAIPDNFTTPIDYLHTNEMYDIFARGKFNPPHDRYFWQNSKFNFDQGYADGWNDPVWQQRYGGYKIGSLGPDWDYNGGLWYDPTNGVVSPGDIYRTQTDPEGRWFGL